MDIHLGLLSGTSMDGIDACLVDFSNTPPRLLATRHTPYPDDLLSELRAVVFDPAAGTVHRLATLDAWLGECFAKAALELIQAADLPQHAIRSIGSHGQTIRHHPHGAYPYTLQLGDPHRIAERTGLTVVADFRRRDIAAGGHGAPLVPLVHAILFANPDETRVIANIGGIANITVLPHQKGMNLGNGVWGFDTGPGNTLMDAWTQRYLGLPYDRDGLWAAQGQVDQRLLQHLLSTPYFTRPAPKSTGPEEFSLAWLGRAHGQALEDLPPENVQATLLELTARTLMDAIRQSAQDAARILVCGGGAFNSSLMRRLQVLAGDIPVESTAAVGIDPAWVEGIAFAWLARQTLQGQPGNLPAVTGAHGERILGAIYPAPPAR